MNAVYAPELKVGDLIRSANEPTNYDDCKAVFVIADIQDDTFVKCAVCVQESLGWSRGAVMGMFADSKAYIIERLPYWQAKSEAITVKV